MAFFVLEAVIGLLNSFMLAGSIDFEGSGAVSAAAIVGAIVVFCFIVFVAHRIPKVSTVSRVVMPVLAAMLVFLPFLSERYNLVFSMLLLGQLLLRRAGSSPILSPRRHRRARYRPTC